jgi:hypothetical protein
LSLWTNLAAAKVHSPQALGDHLAQYFNDVCVVLGDEICHRDPRLAHENVIAILRAAFDARLAALAASGLWGEGGAA